MKRILGVALVGLFVATLMASGCTRATKEEPTASPAPTATKTEAAPTPEAGEAEGETGGETSE